MASKRYSSQLCLSRIWHGIRQYERIKKNEEEEVVCEEEDEISSETAVADRKVRRLFKLSRRRPRRRRSRRVRIRFVLGMVRRLRWAAVLSQLKVSWRRFAKLVKESQPHFTDVLGGNHLFLHLTPPPPINSYNHLEGGGGGCREIDGSSYGHPLYMLYML
uniref:Uncharacterized protein n=1 Tax=Picea sitchensis TaxID=3332 RepID=C0PRB7_PICSI|nr:unknown [Picea sitchensis]